MLELNCIPCVLNDKNNNEKMDKDMKCLQLHSRCAEGKEKNVSFVIRSERKNTSETLRAILKKLIYTTRRSVNRFGQLLAFFIWRAKCDFWRLAIIFCHQFLPKVPPFFKMRFLTKICISHKMDGKRKENAEFILLIVVACITTINFHTLTVNNWAYTVHGGEAAFFFLEVNLKF